MSAAATHHPSNAFNWPATPDAAVDQYRAAKLRRDLVRDGSSVYVHAPRPGAVPTGRACTIFPTYDAALQRGGPSRALVYCYPSRTHVRLRISPTGIYAADNETVKLTAPELRDLAARLIDAAHHLDTLSAATPAAATPMQVAA